MRTIELLPDPVSSRLVREAWERLAAAGLPSQAGHRHPTNRPHLTLATCDDLPAPVWTRLARVLSVPPPPLRVTALHRYEGRVRVLVWRLDPDPALLAVHAAVWRLLGAAPGTGRLNPLHRPGAWDPHLTLARSRDRAQDWTGAEDVLDGALPAPGSFTEARSYDSGTRTAHPLGSWTGRSCI
ncbi:2'-5' RNA ligase family protein [Streptomyces sp. CRN 30]|uniref:2'-5' RNA ligase family protein n=1 Tax=Streptomyces sp. CRN 30 TaxID=3075613 RepID=UPI002A825CC5|nr:2'-5' RNA ligase family protein [Streptomyces sp. CRN 30]